MKFQHLYRYLDTDGDGTGTIDATGDYSDATGTGVEDFYYEAVKGTTIERMLVSVGDTAGMQSQEYGNIGAALTNGVSVLLYNEHGALYEDLTAGQPVKTNAEWGALCFDVDVKTWGSGNELLVARWTFAKSGLPLHLPAGAKLVVRVNDKMDGLLSHRYMIQGHH